MVRDDFWMAATRFLRELDLPLLGHRYSTAVDLFDLPHAPRVLGEFGRAYGALPSDPQSIAPEQLRFWEAAVRDLAEDGLVIPVRLSLFAEMMKNRPWTLNTLREMGGPAASACGSLKRVSADAKRLRNTACIRLPQKAARALLTCLWPAPGSKIRGSMRSREELLSASGYQHRERDFDELVQVLDQQRLIMPVDPESGRSLDEASATVSGRDSDQIYYQLTHDYLVPLLREWLNRKRRETRAGRAQLLLEERAGEWAHSRRSRTLPTLLETLRIAA